MEKASTRPVVMVRSLIHKSSRCRVAGCPGPPMLATCPPGPYECRSQFEGGQNPDSFDGHISSQAAGELREDFRGFLPTIVDVDVMSAPNCLAVARRLSDPSMGHHMGRAEEPAAHDGRQADPDHG